MRRLLHVISFTTDLEQSKRFYRDGIGLSVGADTPFMVNFSTDGTGLVLLAVSPTQRREVELCFESEQVAASVEALRSRGVEFIDELRALEFGSVIHFRDPEGNLLSLLQPGSGAKQTASEREALAAAKSGGEPEATQTSLALAEVPPGRASGPALSTAIVNARDLTAARGYYGHLLALRVSVDSPSWVQYDTGDIRLALYSRRDRNAVELHHTQPVSFGFTVDRLEEWVDQARTRDVKFLSVPADEGFGLTAEIVDPEGNIVVVREPMSEETLEERLAEAWEDEVPHQIAMRSPVRKATRHSSWVATKPEYKAGKKADKPKHPVESDDDEELALPERAKRVPSARGAGPVRSRMKPKNLSDPERVRTRPAIGRLKKAEARTLETAKKAAAERSKGKPVKRAASKRGKGAAKKTAKRRGRGSS
jgi:catechol 2,3-dioxygenase-like lactoylglutathione lyase family enzyme